MTLKLPCTARLIALDPKAGTGMLETSSGEKVRCGVTSFRPYVPEPVVGREYQILEVKTLPMIGLRASVLRELGFVAPPPPPDPDDDEEELTPFGSLDEALDWLRQHGDTVEQAPHAATADEVSALERDLGLRLPEDHVQFLRTRNWIRTRFVASLGIAGSDPLHDIREATRVVRAHCDAQDVGRYPDWIPAVDAVRALTPVVAIGNGTSLPRSLVVLVDGSGRYFGVAMKDFVVDPPPQPFRSQKPFEAILVGILDREHRHR